MNVLNDGVLVVSAKNINLSAMTLEMAKHGLNNESLKILIFEGACREVLDGCVVGE